MRKFGVLPVAGASQTRQLDEQRLLAYDYRPQVYRPFEETYRGQIAPKIEAYIMESFGDREWTFLDVGGGSGVFADYLLSRFSLSLGVLIDTSEGLLSRNAKSERKTILCCTAEKMGQKFNERSFDLICMHDLLHHIVDNRYDSSRQLVRSILLQAKELLTPRGCLSIWEPTYNGWMIDSLPGRLIFGLTSSHMLAPLCARFGANTAGVGVRFLSVRQWQNVLQQCGFSILRYDQAPVLRFSWLVKSFLFIKAAYSVHFWCSAEGEK